MRGVLCCPGGPCRGDPGCGKGFRRIHLMEAERDRWIGSLVKGRYSLLELIGSGGEGRVYLASDSVSGRLVALKLVGKLGDPPQEKDGLIDLSAQFRMIRELRAFSMVDHPNVVRLLDSGVHQGIPFLVMERLTGTDLHKEIARTGGLSWERARPLILQMCDGLGALHAKGIVHRDVKPSNIFVSGTAGKEKVKIIDLDLVKFLGPPEERNVEDSGEVVGTPAYMAPEMLSGGVCDSRLDIYSLGATIYEMLTGIPPYSARNYLELMLMHRESMPRPINHFPLVYVPPEAESVVAKALEHRPEDRFRSISELKEAVEAVPGSGPPDPGGRKGLIRRAADFIRFLFFSMPLDLRLGPEDIPFEPHRRAA